MTPPSSSIWPSRRRTIQPRASRGRVVLGPCLHCHLTSAQCRLSHPALPIDTPGNPGWPARTAGGPGLTSVGRLPIVSKSPAPPQKESSDILPVPQSPQGGRALGQRLEGGLHPHRQARVFLVIPDAPADSWHVTRARGYLQNHHPPCWQHFPQSCLPNVVSSRAPSSSRRRASTLRRRCSSILILQQVIHRGPDLGLICPSCQGGVVLQITVIWGWFSQQHDGQLCQSWQPRSRTGTAMFGNVHSTNRYAGLPFAGGARPLLHRGRLPVTPAGPLYRPGHDQASTRCGNQWCDDPAS